MRFRKMATAFLATLLIISSTTVASAVELDDLVLPDATGIEWHENDENFSNVTGQQGYNMVNDARNGNAEDPFLLLFYSNQCYNCQKLFPYIEDVTETNDLHLYLLDYYNEYGGLSAGYVLNLALKLGTTNDMPILFYFDGTDAVAVNLTVPSVDVDSYENWLFAWDVLDDGSIDGDTINVLQMYISGKKVYFTVQIVDDTVDFDTLQMAVALYNNDGKMEYLNIEEGIAEGENTISIDSTVSYEAAKLFSMDANNEPILPAIDLEDMV